MIVQRLNTIVFLWALFFAHMPSTGMACSKTPSAIGAISERLRTIWVDGENELYLTGYAWHNRHTYRPEKIDGYNEQAWGGGLGKSYYDSDGDWHGLYAFAFQDSHRNVEPIVGYAFLKVANLVQEDVRAGGGLAILVTARPDIFHGIPFPGVLPLVSIMINRLAISTTYIPGSRGAGNVLFVFARLQF